MTTFKTRINKTLSKTLKICLTITLLFVFTFKENSTTVYADSYGGNGKGWSDWSTTPTGNEGEVSAIQYGVITPKAWSNWDINPFYGQVLPIEPTDSSWYINNSIKASGYNGYHFQQTHDFGTELHPNELIIWGDCGAKSLYTWNLGETMHIIGLCADVDCFYWTGTQAKNYIAPAMQLYVDNVQVTNIGSREVPDKSGAENWWTNLDVWGQTIELRMSSANGDNRNNTYLYEGSTCITTQLVKYCHVIEWNEPTGWRLAPYPLQDGVGSQIPVERVVYSYPYPPVLGLKPNYYFVNRETSIENVMGNAIATDIVDGVITPQIHFDKIVYQNGNVETNRAAMLDVSIEQDFELYCSVKNSNNITATAHKTYHIYDLVTPGLEEPEYDEMVDVHIYDRFISEKYKDTIKGTSLWKTNSDYKNLLQEVLNHNEGEKHEID